MTELKIIAGRHSCGKDMDMRITDVKDDNQDIVSWIIYGICKKCSLVLISGLFIQPEKPNHGIDFIVDYNKACKGVKSKNIK